MRRFPTWVWLALALGFAGLSSVMALGWLKRQAAVPHPAQVSSVQVVVAKTAVGQANPLVAAQVAMDVWHQAIPPQGAFSNVQEVVGRVTAINLTPGEIITENKLAPKGTAAGITAMLSPNQRAMTVKVDEASGVAGFLTPGDRVDVVVTVDKGDFGNAPLSKILLQNLRVLGTGQKMESRPGDKPQVVPTVTLEVTSDEGERLALAAQEGRISLVLRGQGDQQLTQTAGVDLHQLLGGSKKVPKEADAGGAAIASAASRSEVEVIRGIEREPVSF